MPWLISSSLILSSDAVGAGVWLGAGVAVTIRICGVGVMTKIWLMAVGVGARPCVTALQANWVSVKVNAASNKTPERRGLEITGNIPVLNSDVGFQLRTNHTPITEPTGSVNVMGTSSICHRFLIK
jgi:hypothetical protein